MEERGENRERKRWELGRSRTRVRPSWGGEAKFKEVFTLRLMQAQSQYQRASASLNLIPWVPGWAQCRGEQNSWRGPPAGKCIQGPPPGGRGHRIWKNS